MVGSDEFPFGAKGLFSGANLLLVSERLIFWCTVFRIHLIHHSMDHTTILQAILFCRQLWSAGAERGNMASRGLLVDAMEPLWSVRRSQDLRDVFFFFFSDSIFF